MKFSFKRIVALALALAMILPFIPELDLSFAFVAKADANPTLTNNSAVSCLGLTAGLVTGTNSPTATWTATGTSIEGALTGATSSTGSFIKTYDCYAATASLFVYNDSGADAKMSFNYKVTSNNADYCTVTVEYGTYK